MVAAKPGPNSLTSTLARDNALQVRVIGAVPGEWTYVRGCTQIAPVFTGEMQDDSDLDGEGFASNIATGLTYTISAAGLRKGEGEGESFAADPGQEIIRLAGTQTGYANVIEGRTWRTDSTGEAYEANFSVEFATEAGDRVALDSWTATLTSRGKPQRIEIPATDVGESVPFGETIPAG
ncbi:phage tail tube protein [Corynebacterium sp. A21]|uniref:phage tail tube protein n=1 Tax=Corynebacterium sp. A21 TaxID=3457318 RepID=UPI003FD28950